jgi:hypothetical protein
MDVDFYSLDRPVQDRFSDATRAIGVPTPIVRESPEDRRWMYWLVAAVAILFGLSSSVVHGVGELESSVAIAPAGFAVAFAVAAAAAAYCVLQVLALRNARAVVPYEPGLYLFPAGVFDARSDPIRVFLHPELKDTSVVEGSKLRIVTDGGEFVFRLPDPGIAAQAKSALQHAGELYSQAVQTSNRREQAMLDPLVDSGFSSPFSPRLKLAKREPVWAKLSLPLAVAIGILVGPALWKGRNAVSEGRLYASALRQNDVPGYRAYLARGGTRPEVSDVLLPRAELAEAIHVGTVEAIEGFATAHPRSKIQAEVDAALRAAVSAELASAQKVGTVTALRDFKQRRSAYPFIAPAVEAATVAIYRSVLADFTPGKSPPVASFYERLLGYTKVHGPKVVVRVARRLPESVRNADTQVKLSAYFMGKQSVPSQYFIGDFAARREAPVVGRLAKAIAASFPADVLAVQVEPTQADPEALPPVTEPTLILDYAPEMAGGYMCPKPRGVFVGVGMMFKASFQIPGDDQPLELKDSLWRTPNPQILKNEGTTVADVYEKMAGDGFAKFEKDFGTLLGQK